MAYEQIFFVHIPLRGLKELQISTFLYTSHTQGTLRTWNFKILVRILLPTFWLVFPSLSPKPALTKVRSRPHLSLKLLPWERGEQCLPLFPRTSQGTIPAKLILGKWWIYWPYLQNIGEVYVYVCVCVLLLQKAAPRSLYPAGIMGCIEQGVGSGWTHRGVSCVQEEIWTVNKPSWDSPFARGPSYFFKVAVTWLWWQSCTTPSNRFVTTIWTFNGCRCTYHTHPSMSASLTS